MVDLINKTLKLGFDLLSTGKKHSKLVAADLEKHYKLTKPQAKRLATDLSKHINAAQKDTMNIIEDNLKGVVSQKDINKVRRALKSKPTKKKPKRKKK
jgi:polyhydroxyalkanoate synthesis regulator phasin